MTFSDLHNPLRTDDSFKHGVQEEHHRENSNLESLEFGMVSQIPVEYIPLVCLVVMKRLLQFWYKGN